MNLAKRVPIRCLLESWETWGTRYDMIAVSTNLSIRARGSSSLDLFYTDDKLLITGISDNFTYFKLTKY